MALMVRCAECDLSIDYDAAHAGHDGVSYCAVCCPECVDSDRRDNAGIPVRSTMNAAALSSISGCSALVAAVAMIVQDEVNKTLALDFDSVEYELAVERVRDCVARLREIAQSVGTCASALEGSPF